MRTYTLKVHDPYSPPPLKVFAMALSKVSHLSLGICGTLTSTWGLFGSAQSRTEQEVDGRSLRGFHASGQDYEVYAGLRLTF